MGRAFEGDFGGCLGLGSAAVHEAGSGDAFVGFERGVLGFRKELADLVEGAAPERGTGSGPDLCSCAVGDLADAQAVVAERSFVLSGAQEGADLLGFALESLLGCFADSLERALQGEVLDFGAFVFLNRLLPARSQVADDSVVGSGECGLGGRLAPGTAGLEVSLRRGVVGVWGGV
ncbi:hypothetical protein GCM10010507_60580 [Streptomyces cinnamoneus]|uniref:Uncharacterized protein n=1 Tax=Streptomyces cinnamoneus TaxID=53446 RepID=A0A918TZW2_STRCJ|nr:hypothetical protein [Streptomyces cinnamoneus]GHC73268.1 hypothetical protein GCM10010507_60580 [Streptomyces cinnamoneus]